MKSNLEETIIEKSDIDIVQMLFVEKEKYTHESIKLAEKEYMKRNISDGKKDHLIKSLKTEKIQIKENISKKHQEITFIAVATVFYAIAIRFDWFNNLPLIGGVVVAGLMGVLSSIVVSMIFIPVGKKSEKINENKEDLAILELENNDGKIRQNEKECEKQNSHSGLYASNEEVNKGKWYWPNITDVESAKAAVQIAFWAAIIIASLTAVLATISLITKQSVATINAWAYSDSVIMFFLAWRIKKMSRVFSVIALLLFVIGKGISVQAQTPEVLGIVIALVIVLMLINGVRGTFAHHKYITTELEK